MTSSNKASQSHGRRYLLEGDTHLEPPVPALTERATASDQGEASPPPTDDVYGLEGIPESVIYSVSSSGCEPGPDAGTTTTPGISSVTFAYRDHRGDEHWFPSNEHTDVAVPENRAEKDGRDPHAPVGTSASIPWDIDPFTRMIVRTNARRIARNHGFLPQDQDDIQQSLYMRLAGLLKTAKPDDPKWRAVVAKAVRRWGAKLIRDRYAAKRDYRREKSLSVKIVIQGGEQTELTHAISEQEHNSRVQRPYRSHEESAQRVNDVADAIASLPTKLRDLALCLRTQSVSQIARDTGTPRTTLYYRLNCIRKRFEKAGLRKYL